MDHRKRVNLAELRFAYDEERPEGFRRGRAQLGPTIGATQLGATVYELPAGQSIGPYQYQYEDEEWLLVLEGRVTLRHSGGLDELDAGDVVCFPAGPEGGHRVTCHGDETARVMMLSTRRRPAIAIYPDSDKVAIWRVDERDHLMMRRDRLAYYDGET